MWEDLVNHPNPIPTINTNAGRKWGYFTFALVMCNISTSNAGISKAFSKSVLSRMMY